jgi:hypothetical protein
MVKGETVMPVPEGVITGTDTWTEPVVELDEAIVEADAEEATAEYVEDEDDLPELS